MKGKKAKGNMYLSWRQVFHVVQVLVLSIVVTSGFVLLVNLYYDFTINEAAFIFMIGGATGIISLILLILCIWSEKR